MFWTAAYLIAAYLVVVVVVSLLHRLWTKPSPARVALLVGILLAPFLPYAVVGAQTAIFGSGLRPYVRQAMLDTGMMDGEIVTMRVMSITPWRASVYVTQYCNPRTKDGQVADVLTLRRTSAGWKLLSWDTTVWSDCGSAEGNTFPPFPEAREF